MIGVHGSVRYMTCWCWFYVEFFAGCSTTCMEQFTWVRHWLTARDLSPSTNISRLIYSTYLSRKRIDCVKRPCSSPGRLRRYKFVKLRYITHYIFRFIMPKIHYTRFPVTFPYLLTCYGLVADLSATRPTSSQQVVVMEFEKRNDTTDTTEFARANLLSNCYGEVVNLLQTCYGETNVMNFGL